VRAFRERKEEAGQRKEEERGNRGRKGGRNLRTAKDGMTDALFTIFSLPASVIALARLDAALGKVRASP
jgi:hypothetical protein